MQMCQLIVEKNLAFDCVGTLGRLGIVHFKDMNPDATVFQRSFVQMVRRCDDAERGLRNLEKEVKRADPPIEITAIDEEPADAPHPRIIQDLETQAADLGTKIEQLKENESALKRSLNEMCEYKHVLLKVDTFFEENLDEEARMEMSDNETEDPDGEEGIPLMNPQDTQRWFIAGVLDFSKKLAFERCLWRACKRTAFVRTAEIEPYFEDPFNGQIKKKCVFIVFFKGERIRDIIDRVCEGYKAQQYPCARTSKERRQAVFSTAARMDDIRVVIETTALHIRHELTQTSLFLNRWLRDISILKTVYHAMNQFKFDSSGNFFVADCWIAESDVGVVRKVLEELAANAGSTIKPVVNIISTEETPPTYNKTNKFTEIFQNIVDAYGIATYREVNPAPYSIITFPFLFSLMFGDCGHGAFLLLAGLFLVYKEHEILKRSDLNEICLMFFNGRYIICLMGFFSIYAGFIYNDVFSKSMNLFGSRWYIPFNVSTVDSWSHSASAHLTLDPEAAFDPSRGPYPFGIDPIWNVALNRLTFQNSLKMKLSVIIGIAQMTFGLFLSAINHVNFKSPVNFFTCFIPQIVFLSSIFVYLLVQIILKWIYFWVKSEFIFGNFYPGSYCAPSLLIGLINMFMLKPRSEGFVQHLNGTTDGSNYEELRACYLNQWYPHQATVEVYLLLIAVACVPVMLLGRPVAFLLRQKNGKEQARQLGDVQSENEGLLTARQHPVDPKPSEDERKEEGFGDVFIHQVIHTIEFVLGCISHTASYLRLWALSLAGAVILFLTSVAFLVITLGILVLMEGLSAFLHTLRLHWVEFQSKFYGGWRAGLRF
ncbi:hypothetical protein L596_004201 [Steinernema carpocapsae]|uniref:V-type proton ATPase subunit a n=2 Tax=Steinernema carpocapsae TaxID=34508 RepID=A0A4U8UWL6_STECR|nr:hypothetical protein L596_004201 [Steinernema carpocapsae]